MPKLACQHLGLPFTRSSKPITLLGGLTPFGGAGNNYSMHVSHSRTPCQLDTLSPMTTIQCLTAMVRELRRGNGQNGWILANGGVLTYQHAVCLSTQPRRAGSSYPEMNPLPPYVTNMPVPRISAQAEGEAIVEVDLTILRAAHASSILMLVG